MQLNTCQTKGSTNTQAHKSFIISKFAQSHKVCAKTFYPLFLFISSSSFSFVCMSLKMLSFICGLESFINLFTFFSSHEEMFTLIYTDKIKRRRKKRENFCVYVNFTTLFFLIKFSKLNADLCCRFFSRFVD